MNNKTYQKLIWVFVAIAAITYGCSTYKAARLREKNGYAAPPQQDQQAARLRLKEDQKLQDAARLRREEDQEAIAHLQQARKKEARLRRKGEEHKAARVNFHQRVQKKKPLHTIDEGYNYP